MKRLVSFGIFFLSLFSCSSGDQYEQAHKWSWDDFKEQKLLQGQVLEFDSLVMQPNDLRVYDSLLITINYNCDKLFHVFNLNTKKQVGQRIGRGQGPNEMLQPRFVEGKKDVVQVFDMATSRVYEYAVQDFAYNPNPQPIRNIKLEKSIFINACETGNQIYGYAYNPKYQLMAFNEQGKKEKELIDFPPSTISYSDTEKTDAFYMNFITDQKDKIVICYCMTDLIEIYHTDGTLVGRLHGPDGFFARFQEVHDGEVTTSSPEKGRTRDAFFSPENAGNEFFVLYSGKYIDAEDYSQLSYQLFSFTWDGKPQCLFNLSDGIFTCTVDTQRKKIYGISDDPEFHIVEFDY